MIVKKEKLREYAATICDVFEDLLEECDITIPDEDREGFEDEARIFGYTYEQLEDNVTAVLEQLVKNIEEAIQG